MSETEFLNTYSPEKYAKPSVTTDVVIFTVQDCVLKVLLIKRKGHPFKGAWAIPGGFLEVGDGLQNQGESLEEGAARELEEETSLPQGSCFLEQLKTYGNPGRDPRMRVITVAYYALVPSDLAPLVKAADDAAEAEWFSVDSLESVELAFDHAKILQDAVERVRGKIDYYPKIAFRLVPNQFTMSELRSVYEAIKGTTYDASNFRRRFNRMLEDERIFLVEGKRQQAVGRPAKVYRINKDS